MCIQSRCKSQMYDLWLSIITNRPFARVPRTAQRAEGLDMSLSAFKMELKIIERKLNIGVLQDIETDRSLIERKEYLQKQIDMMEKPMNYSLVSGGVKAGKREKIAEAVEKLDGRVLVTIREATGNFKTVSMTPEDAARHIRGPQGYDEEKALPILKAFVDGKRAKSFDEMNNEARTPEEFEKLVNENYPAEVVTVDTKGEE